MNQFRYLGALIIDVVTTDNKSIIAMAKNDFNKKREFLSIRMKKDLKKKVIKTIFFELRVVWIGNLDMRHGLVALEILTL